jgi:hypothetical protein
MSSTDPRSLSARQRALNAFAKLEKREPSPRDQVANARDAEAKKIARLRALRLAKEAAEKTGEDPNGG